MFFKYIIFLQAYHILSYPPAFRNQRGSKNYAFWIFCVRKCDVSTRGRSFLDCGILAEKAICLGSSDLSSEATYFHSNSACYNFLSALGFYIFLALRLCWPQGCVLAGRCNIWVTFWWSPDLILCSHLLKIPRVRILIVLCRMAGLFHLNSFTVSQHLGPERKGCDCVLTGECSLL